MAIRRFVKAAGNKTGAEYRGLDRIPGTNKVRTYVTGAWLYSKESDLENIIANEQRARAFLGKEI